MNFLYLFSLSIFVFHSTFILGDRNINYLPTETLAIEHNLEEFWSGVISKVDNIGANIGIEQVWKEIRSRTLLTSECRSTLDSVVENWQQKESSAQLFTSTGFSLFPGGLSQTSVEFGDYDSCMKIRESSNSNWIGQYCVATLNIPRSKLFCPTNITEILPQVPKWKLELLQKWYDFDNHYSLARGFCSPSNCDETDLKNILQEIFPLLNSFDLQVKFCQTFGDKKIDSRIWIPVMIFCCSLLFVVAGTLYSCCVQANRTFSKLDSCIRAFNVINNFQKLFNLNTQQNISNTTNFGCFHGLRVILTIIVIIVHVTFGQMSESKILPVKHFPRVMQEQNTAFTTYIMPNSQFGLGLFMLMSSILLAYTELKKGSLKNNIWEYVFLRWIRYIPTSFGCFCIYLMLPLLGDGPLYHTENFRLETDQCYDYWWRHLLLIQNFFDMRQMCIQTSWFMACEFQLRMISFGLVLLYSHISSRGTIIGASALILVGAIIHISVHLQIGVIPLAFVMLFPEYPYQIEYFRWIYSSALLYIGIYCIGFLIGQFLIEKRNFEFTPGKTILIVVLWIFAHAYNTFHTEKLLSENRIVEYDASVLTYVLIHVSNLLINIFIGYFIFYLLKNPSNPIFQFLSHRFFLPFSRLSFCVYLVHIATISYMDLQARSPISMDNSTLLSNKIFSTVVQSFVMAIVIHVVFEAPFYGVIRVLRQRTQKPIKNEPNMELVRIETVEIKK